MLSRLLRLWCHLSRRRRIQSVLVLLLAVLSSAAEAASVGALLPFLATLTRPEDLFRHPSMTRVIEFVGATRPADLLLPVTIVFGLAAVSSGAVRLLFLWASTRVSHAIGADLSASMYRRTLYQPYSVHVERNSSDVITGIATKASGVVSFSLMPILNAVGGLFMLLSVSLILVAINPAAAFGAFVGFGLIYIPVIAVANRRLARDGARANRETTRVMKALHEGLGGIRDVLVDGTQELYCRIYQQADQPLRRANANIFIVGAAPRFAIEALGMLLLAGLAYWMSGQPGGLAGAVPVLGAIGLGAQRLLPAIQQVYGSWATVRGGTYWLDEALYLLDQPMPAFAGKVQSILPFEHQIQLTDLSFRYSDRTPFVLNRINIHIPKGGRVGFVGATGSGKSTLLDIVMALLSPTAGRLSVDGVDVTRENARSWQTHLAHVPQAIYLADSSIAENIAFGVEQADIDLDRVMAAARQAQIHDAIAQMPDGYASRVGERGVRLSGGQRQRIGIARALYKRASVIILDEATSALDGATEASVMEAIERIDASITVLVVAHRTTTLRNCTQVVELVNGSVRRVGTYEQVIGTGAAAESRGPGRQDVPHGTGD